MSEISRPASMWDRFVLRSKIVDPELMALRSGILSAVCCLATIILYEYFHLTAVIGWAIFAAMAYSQIDSLELPGRRLQYMGAIAVLFALISYVGISLSTSTVWYLVSVAIVIFVCGYLVAYGLRYFIPGMWAMFLYVAFGSIAGSRNYAGHVAVAFIVTGVLCIGISLLFFPERPINRMKKIGLRILEGIRDLAPNTNALLSAQASLYRCYLTDQHTSAAQQAAFWHLHKSLYQVYLLRVQVRELREQAARHTSYSSTEIDGTRFQTEQLINCLIPMLQGQDVAMPDIQAWIDHHRASIKEIQVKESQLAEPDWQSILDYSNILYHIFQIWQLLAELKSSIQQIVRGK